VLKIASFAIPPTFTSHAKKNIASIKIRPNLGKKMGLSEAVLLSMKFTKEKLERL
jgi:hypothetical protein